MRFSLGKAIMLRGHGHLNRIKRRLLNLLTSGSSKVQPYVISHARKRTGRRLVKEERLAYHTVADQPTPLNYLM